VTEQAAVPPIVRLAETILLECETVVRGFSRYHKYTIGTDIRQQAMHILRLAHRAWRLRKQQAELVRQLVWAVDDLKMSLQLGKQLAAFRSFVQFEQLAIRVLDLGRQCGGWLRALGRNAAATSAHPSTAPVPVVAPQGKQAECPRPQARGQRPEILRSQPTKATAVRGVQWCNNDDGVV